jgi:large exoprotein involved in heme utilization and adhesion
MTLRTGTDTKQMQRNSKITTNAEGSGMGGNIRINTDILVGLENSDITATAVEGRGGNIQINTQGIFGIEPRSERSPETSDITARSELRVDGLVEINRPDINLNSGLVSLPAELVDVTGLIAQGCGAGGGDGATSKIIATGRGGLPPTPTEALRSDIALVDFTPIKTKGDRLSANISTNSVTPTPLVEAQRWAIRPQGKVVLTAQASASSHSLANA